MNKYDAEKALKALNKKKDPAKNSYEGVPRDQRAALFYGTSPPDENGNRWVAPGGRRDLRDYIEANGRLLPMEPGSAPMTREVMEKLFHGTSGKQRREERQAKKDAARLQRHIDADFKRACVKAPEESVAAE